MPTFVSDYTAILGEYGYWVRYFGTPTVVTYSFDTAPGAHIVEQQGYSQAFSDSFQPFTAHQEALTEQALDDWSEVSGLIFVEVPAGQGDIRFGNYNFDLDPSTRGFGGFAFYPWRFVNENIAFDGEIGGDVFIDIDYLDTMSWYLIAHEIGHAIGFGHPHEGDIQLEEDYDNDTYTVLTYNVTGYGQLGPFDIEAVEYVYNAPDFDTTNNSDIEQFQYNKNTQVVTQVWGAGSSKILGTSLDDAINARGGHDMVAGFDGNDTLRGGAGNDTMFGGDDDDLFVADAPSGAGADHMDGGAGVDTVDYSDRRDKGRVLVDLQFDLSDSGFAQLFDHGAAEGDTYSNVENVMTYEYGAADNLRGNAADNYLSAGGSSDRLYGRAGNDTLNGGDGADALYGNMGADVMTGGGGPARMDRFIYFSMEETGVYHGNRDVITDFKSGEDRIEIRRLDADITQPGRQGFDFIGADPFSNTAGELRFDQRSHTTIVQGDVDGDGRADFEIELTGSMTLSEDDFLI